MEFGLSRDTLQVIEERFGKPWSDRALVGIMVMIFVTPLLIAATFILMSLESGVGH